MTHVDDFYKVDCDGVTRTLESGGWAASAGKLTWVCMREGGGVGAKTKHFVLNYDHPQHMLYDACC